MPEVVGGKDRWSRVNGHQHGGPVTSAMVPDVARRGGYQGPTEPGSGADAWITPDAVALDVEVATVGSRGIAYLLDLALVWSCLLLLQLAQLLIGWEVMGAGWVAVTIMLLAAFAVQFGYPIGFEVLWRGRTLGKAALGLRVITVEGAPVGFRHAVIRAVAGVFELLSTLGMLAIGASFVSRRGQRLGDLAAGTVVIRERRARRPVGGLTYQLPPGWESYAQQLDLGDLGPAELALIRDTLRRADQLPSTARREVMDTVAGSLVDRVSPRPPAHADPEAWLRCLAARLAARVSSTPR